MAINVKIKSTNLSFNDLGMVNITLTLSWEGNEQSFGGLFLEYPMQIVKRLLNIANADSWESLPGKEVYADVEDGKITNIFSPGRAHQFGSYTLRTVEGIVEFAEYA